MPGIPLIGSAFPMTHAVRHRPVSGLIEEKWRASDNQLPWPFDLAVAICFSEYFSPDSLSAKTTRWLA